MTTDFRQPQPDDLVLGGQNVAPAGAVVLGGIEGVRIRLASRNLEEKEAGVLQALNYGEKGIAALFEVLEKESNPEIQWLAYQVLEKQDSQEIQAKLKNYFGWYDYESVTVNHRGEMIKRTPGRAKYYREDLGNGVYLDMVYIAGGTFLMGSPTSEKKSEWSKGKEEPRHQVTVSSFWMGKYAVTQAQWQAVMDNNPSCFQGTNRPVERVSWYVCQGFCHKLSQQTGKRYRLPSEAEWEYACRAGTTTPFNCGETITAELANYNGNYIYAKQIKGQYKEQTVEVGSFPPNAWGLYEMHGNVREWCEDGWHDHYQRAPRDGSAWTDNHSSTKSRVLRGGSWNNNPGSCRSASRDDNRDSDNYYTDSLRLVLEWEKRLFPVYS